MNDNDAEPVGGREALIRLSALFRTRNPAVVDEFAPDGILVGSGPGEIARGVGELRPFFTTLFAGPARISWDWQSIDFASAGRIAWVFAEGHVVLNDDASERRLPYRLSGVLQQDGASWKWRLFHGSEPSVG